MCSSSGEAEEQVAKYIEEQVALYDQRELGARTRRDGNGGLRIDFTYDAAMPPVGLFSAMRLVPGCAVAAGGSVR
jgi:hypothetical protein